MRTKLLLIITLCLIAVLTRTVFKFGPNIEFVTAASIAAGFVLRSGYALGVPLIIMVVSDMLLGNSLIFLFTWSAYILAPLFSNIIRKQKGIRLIAYSSLAGSFFTIFFYLWTNLGVVVVSQMYSKDFSGLIQSYVNGLPFLTNQLLGNILFTPLAVLVSSAILRLNKTNFVLNTDPAGA